MGDLNSSEVRNILFNFPRIHRWYFQIHTKLLLIANLPSLSLTLDADGGIAASEKILAMNLQFQEGWGDFSPFLFLSMQQENSLSLYKG